MARPKWRPRTDEQRRAIAAAERAGKRADEAEAKLWDAVAPALELGVPAAYLAERVGRSRTTLYRRVPHAGGTARHERGADD